MNNATMPIHVLDGVDTTTTGGVGAVNWNNINAGIESATKLVNVTTQLTDKGFGWYNQQKDLEHRRKMDEINADIQRQNDEHIRRLQEMQMQMQAKAPTYTPPAPASLPTYYAAPPRPIVTTTGTGSRSKMLILAVASIGAVALLLLATRK